MGREYTSNKFYEFFALYETIYQISYTDTLEQNDVTERKHRHIIETAHFLLFSASIPNVFWEEVVLTTIGLINTILSSYISGFSQFKNLYRYTPYYFFFRVFGYICFILHSHIESNELSSRYVICVFLSYSEGKKGYHCFDPITQKLYMSHHVVVLEHIPLFFIPSITCSLIRSDLIHIDPFFFILIVYHLRFLVLQITLLIFNQFVMIILQVPILYSMIHLKLPFSFIVPQASFKIADPYLCQSICIRKSIKLPDFAYSCYSSSFTFFLAFIHYLSKPCYYKEAIIDPLW